ncbi:MAG: DUF4397 domain-containing protein [Oscillospiraceae bacterium]|nr:DUF4397 domain-containing protein [Oscillospiraceae bacterium]
MPLPPDSYVRILHASPDAPAVDIYANGNLIAKNLVYKQLTDYVAVKPNEYTIQVYPAGQKNNPVIDTKLTIPPMSSITVAAINKLANISLLPIMELYMPMYDKRISYIKFAHLSPNAPAVDIALPDGTKLFTNIKYKQYTDYINAAPGNYTLLVKPTGTDQVALTVPNVNLLPGKIYTVYAVGLLGETPPLDAIISIDNEY